MPVPLVFRKEWFGRGWFGQSEDAYKPIVEQLYPACVLYAI